MAPGPPHGDTEAVRGWQEVPLEPIDEPLVALAGDARLIVHPIYKARGHADALDAVYVRAGVAERLREAALLLPAETTLLVLDGWRSHALQTALYADIRAEIAASSDLRGAELAKATGRFVVEPSEDPRCPTPHLTGGAVDLTLADANGDPLDMGSGFDEVGARARTDYFETSHISGGETAARDRRRLLCGTLHRVGFANYPEEWWHFDLGNQFWGLMTGRRAYYGKANPF